MVISKTMDFIDYIKGIDVSDFLDAENLDVVKERILNKINVSHISVTMFELGPHINVSKIEKSELFYDVRPGYALASKRIGACIQSEKYGFKLTIICRWSYSRIKNMVVENDILKIVPDDYDKASIILNLMYSIGDIQFIMKMYKNPEITMESCYRIHPILSYSLNSWDPSVKTKRISKKLMKKVCKITVSGPSDKYIKGDNVVSKDCNVNCSFLSEKIRDEIADEKFFIKFTDAIPLMK